MNELVWMDFLILRLTMLHQRSSKLPPTLRELFGPGNLINTWLEENDIGRPFATPVNYSREVQESISRLREVGLVELAGRAKITPRGIAVSRDLANRPREWPYSVPILKGMIHWNLAIYVEV